MIEAVFANIFIKHLATWITSFGLINKCSIVDFRLHCFGFSHCKIMMVSIKTMKKRCESVQLPTPNRAHCYIVLIAILRFQKVNHENNMK